MKWIWDGAFWEIPVALYPLPTEGKRLPLRAGRGLSLALGAAAVTTAFKRAQIAGWELDQLVSFAEVFIFDPHWLLENPES